MRRFLLLAVLCASACSLRTAFVHPGFVAATGEMRAAPVRYRLILIGDAGQPAEPEPVLDAVRAWAMREPDKTIVVFLGDNAYPAGVITDLPGRSISRLKRLVASVKGTGAEVVFVPGNHDWDDGGVRGLEAVTKQAAFLRGLDVPTRPTAGCPGPEYVDRPAGQRPVVRIVFLDTQWWLHEHGKGTGCTPGSEDAVVAALAAALATPLPVVIAAHHPLASHGPHGGFHDWKSQLFPLTKWQGWAWLPAPGVGPFVRRYLIRSSQELAGRANIRMRRALARALAGESAALRVFAAGHEHSLQVLAGSEVDYVLVAGAGSSGHAAIVGRGPDTLFAHQQAGFMVLDVTDEGVRLRVIEPAAPVSEPLVTLLRKR